MNLQEFIQFNAAKYAVISALSYYNFPVAAALATSPRMFNTEDMTYVILSLRDEELPMLIGYIRTIGFDVEFGFTEGTGKVSLLLLEEVLQLLELYDPEE